MATKTKGKGGKGGKGKGKGDTAKAVTAKTAKPPKVTTFALAKTAGGKTAGAAVSSVGSDGVVRTRAQWNGYSLSSLLKWVGKNGGDINNARQLVSALGLEDVTSKSTVSCQFYAGVQLGTKGGEPNHSGAAADLDKSQATAVRKLAGM